MAVVIVLPGGGFGSPIEQESARAFEAALHEALQRQQIGTVDGNQVGQGEWRILAKAHDLEAARRCVAQALLARLAPDPSLVRVEVAPSRPRRSRRIVKGLVFAIPISGGYAHAQFVGPDPQRQMGDLVRVFRRVSAAPATLTELDTERVLFGPVFAAFWALVRDGTWPAIGRARLPAPAPTLFARRRPGRDGVE